MLKKILVPTFLMTFVLNAANAEDWVGQTQTPTVNGSVGPFIFDPMAAAPVSTVCYSTAKLPPCAPGDSEVYTWGAPPAGPSVPMSSVPVGAGPGSGVGVLVEGAIVDPAAPAGISLFGGSIPLDAFAKSSTVDALAATTNDLATQINNLGGTVNGLSTQMQVLSTDLAQVQQQLALQDRSLRQGVAMSLAMDGTGTLGPDEHFAMSMNWGTFGGQNGVAGSIAFRAADHVTFDGGIGTGLHGGLVGGRAGVRIAW